MAVANGLMDASASSACSSCSLPSIDGMCPKDVASRDRECTCNVSVLASLDRHNHGIKKGNMLGTIGNRILNS